MHLEECHTPCPFAQHYILDLQRKVQCANSPYRLSFKAM